MKELEEKIERMEQRIIALEKQVEDLKPKKRTPRVTYEDSITKNSSKTIEEMRAMVEAGCTIKSLQHIGLSRWQARRFVAENPPSHPAIRFYACDDYDFDGSDEVFDLLLERELEGIDGISRTCDEERVNFKVGMLHIIRNVDVTGEVFRERCLRRRDIDGEVLKGFPEFYV